MFLILKECKKYTCTCENSQDCLCTILGNYVKACAEKETSMVGWRAGLCGKQIEALDYFLLSFTTGVCVCVCVCVFSVVCCCCSVA